MEPKDLRARPRDPAAVGLALDRLAMLKRTTEPTAEEDELEELPELPSEDLDVVAELRNK